MKHIGGKDNGRLWSCNGRCSSSGVLNIPADGYFEILTQKDFVDLMIDRDVQSLYTVGAKSISREVTFQEDVDNYELLKDVLVLLALSVEERAKRLNLHGKGVTLKLTYTTVQSCIRR